MSLAAPPAEIADLVADWEAVPEVSVQTANMDAPTVEAAFTKVNAWTDPSVAMRTTKLSDAPDTAVAPVVEPSEIPVLAAVALPVHSTPSVDRDVKVAAMAAPVMPRVAHAPPSFEAPEPAERAVLETPRPEKRPEKRAPAPALVARGTGGGVGAGTLAATQVVATVSPVARKAAQAAWAGKIQSRIARHQSYPRSARGQGRVRLQMDILSDGRLGAVRVDRSSGVAAFDKAALRAAQSAAPFPPAPNGLDRTRYTFAQWVNFSR
ncbi:MAG: TonB family protein [Boseongicola sp.]|nr:TonB family protein [Boseongicola sp.]